MNDNEYTLLYYVIPILALIITSLAQIFITGSYNKYKKKSTQSNKKGCDVARTILDKYNLKNVSIEAVSGNLTDHYDPTKKVVRLSEDIYNGSSIAAFSVAAHECGHAIQDKVGFIPMMIRRELIPIVNFSTKIGYLIITIGLVLGVLKLSGIGVFLLLGVLLFQLITLPVEFDASRRGKRELKELNILNSSEQRGARMMLRAAAFTYVASVISTLFEILRLARIVSPRKERK